MKNKDYQFNYTENVVAKDKLYNQAEREYKTQKIIDVLSEHYGARLSHVRLLDMSCSTGFMANYMSKHAKSVVGIDIDENAIKFAQEHNSRDNLDFVVMDALHSTFAEGSFDIVICNQMYEHVPSAELLMKEIYRVLKPGGVCFFGATNRLKVIETHYGKIPFLSYLPKTLAHLYLRLLKKGTFYYENLYSYWGLKRLTENFHVIDYTIKIIESPQKYHAEDIIHIKKFPLKIVAKLCKTFYPLLPGYIWLLQKK